MAIYSGFTHSKWWFSIVTLVYQRVLCQSRAFLPRAGLGASLGQDRDKALRERQHYEEKLQDLQSARPGKTTTVAVAL